MKRGKVVTVETFDHALIECRMVAVTGQTVLVCSNQEWQRATAEHREPDCLGWPLAYVRGIESESLTVIDQHVRRDARESRIREQ